MNMLRAESLTFHQGDFVLRDVNLDCAAGECLALLGPSGSGKTTCLEILAGLRGSASGRVWIDDRDVTDLPPERRAVSYLPQDVALFPHLSVRENIEFPARMRRHAPDPQRLHDICGMLDILPLLDRPNVGSLSGGEAQRVAIARALMVPPKILFLDECFGALDAPLRRRLARQFRDLRQRLGTTTVLVTHDIGEACLMADRLAVLHRGAMQQIGTPDELHRRPATVHVAELLGMHNLLTVKSCRKAGTHWRCDMGGFELCLPRKADAASPPERVGFFGWDIVPSPLIRSEGSGRDQDTNLLRLRVVDAIRQGPVVAFRLSTETQPRTILEAHWRGEQSVPNSPPNAVLEVHVPMEKIHHWSST